MSKTPRGMKKYMERLDAEGEAQREAERHNERLVAARARRAAKEQARMVGYACEDIGHMPAPAGSPIRRVLEILEVALALYDVACPSQDREKLESLGALLKFAASSTLWRDTEIDAYGREVVRRALRAKLDQDPA